MADVSAFLGTWTAESREGDFDQFLTERGVPLVLRKVIQWMTSRGTVKFEVKDDKWIETEIGTLKSTEKVPLPLDGTPTPTKAPTGQPSMSSLAVENSVLTISMVVGGDDKDVVTHEFSFEGAKIKRKISNHTGTSFTITLAREE